MIKEHSDLVASWRVELWRLARLVPWSLYPRIPLGGAQGGGRLHHLHHHHHEHDDEGVQRASQRGLHLAPLGSPWRLIPRQPGRRNPAPRGLKIKFEKCTRAKIANSEWKLQQLTPRTWFSYSHWSALPFETKLSHSRILETLDLVPRGAHQSTRSTKQYMICAHWARTFIYWSIAGPRWKSWDVWTRQVLSFLNPNHSTSYCLSE